MLLKARVLPPPPLQYEIDPSIPELMLTVEDVRQVNESILYEEKSIRILNYYFTIRAIIFLTLVILFV